MNLKDLQGYYSVHINKQIPRGGQNSSKEGKFTENVNNLWAIITIMLSIILIYDLHIINS